VWIAFCALTVFFAVVAMKYLLVTPDRLPSFMPGSLNHTSGFVRYKVPHVDHPLRRNAAISAGLAVVSLLAAVRLGSRLISG
jgi:hypothetical protein